MRCIPLNNHPWYALVDDEDHERLSAHRWTYNSEWGYAQRHQPGTGNTITVYLHREVLGAKADELVDHVNGNGLNNRRANLRSCSHTGNSCNRRKVKRATSSRFKGVYWSTRKGTWIAQISIAGKHVHLGSFRVEEDAARAYDEAAPRYHGGFARLNNYA